MRNIMELRTLWSALLVALAIAVAAACTGGDDDDAGEVAADVASEANEEPAGERLQIVASTGIIAHFAEQIAGDDADVVSVIPPGADAHTFSPTTAAIRAVSAADLVIVNGYNLEESTLDTIFEQLRDDARLVVATVGITPLEGGHHHHDEEEGHDHEVEGHEDEDDHEHDEDEEGHEHDEDEEGHDEDEGHEDEDDHEHDEDEEGHAHDEDEEGHDEDEGHEDEEAHDHDEDEEGHDDDKKLDLAAEHQLAIADGDPHMWLTVPNAMVYVRNIANAIVDADPDNA
ncbi:MAG: hypothetical protein F4X26_10165, partial [Chloroflexi bacterium]|nr:hypothetical protein [Chloroflexota bacterium]